LLCQFLDDTGLIQATQTLERTFNICEIMATDSAYVSSRRHPSNEL